MFAIIGNKGKFVNQSHENVGRGCLKKEFSRTESQNIVLMNIIQIVFESFAKVLSQ